MISFSNFANGFHSLVMFSSFYMCLFHLSLVKKHKFRENIKVFAINQKINVKLRFCTYIFCSYFTRYSSVTAEVVHLLFTNYALPTLKRFFLNSLVLNHSQEQSQMCQCFDFTRILVLSSINCKANLVLDSFFDSWFIQAPKITGSCSFILFTKFSSFIYERTVSDTLALKQVECFLRFYFAKEYHALLQSSAFYIVQYFDITPRKTVVTIGEQFLKGGDYI